MTVFRPQSLSSVLLALGFFTSRRPNDEVVYVRRRSGSRTCRYWKIISGLGTVTVLRAQPLSSFALVVRGRSLVVALRSNASAPALRHRRLSGNSRESHLFSFRMHQAARIFVQYRRRLALFPEHPPLSCYKTTTRGGTLLFSSRGGRGGDCIRKQNSVTRSAVCSVAVPGLSSV